MKVKEIELSLLISLILMLVISILLFIYKPINPHIENFNEESLGKYLEKSDARDQIILLNKDGDYYELGYFPIPNFSFSKLKTIMRIKKEDLEILNIEKMEKYQIIYSNICRKLIKFNNYKPRITSLNYRNENFNKKEQLDCKEFIDNKLVWSWYTSKDVKKIELNKEDYSKYIKYVSTYYKVLSLKKEDVSYFYINVKRNEGRYNELIKLKKIDFKIIKEPKKNKFSFFDFIFSREKYICTKGTDIILENNINTNYCLIEK